MATLRASLRALRAVRAAPVCARARATAVQRRALLAPVCEAGWAAACTKRSSGWRGMSTLPTTQKGTSKDTPAPMDKPLASPPEDAQLDELQERLVERTVLYAKQISLSLTTGLQKHDADSLHIGQINASELLAEAAEAAPHVKADKRFKDATSQLQELLIKALRNDSDRLQIDVLSGFPQAENEDDEDKV